MKEENVQDSKLRLMDENGTETEYDVLFTFDSDETKRSYIVYTDNTTDETGSTKVYASIYDPSGNDRNLKPIEDEKEWLLIENILSSIQEKVDSEEETN